MSRAGRKPHAIPRVRKDFYIRADIAAKLDLILLDPMRQKVKYGKWSELIEMLCGQWIAEQQGIVAGRIQPRVDSFKVQLAIGQLVAIRESTSREDTTRLIEAAVQLLREARGESVRGMSPGCLRFGCRMARDWQKPACTKRCVDDEQAEDNSDAMRAAKV